MLQTVRRGGLLLRIGQLVGLDIAPVLETDKPKGKKIISGFPYGYDKNGVVYGLLGADGNGFYLHSALNDIEPRVRIGSNNTVYLRTGNRKEYNFRRYQTSLG